MHEEKPIIVGFSGTQQGMTAFQETTVRSLLRWLKPAEVHHGDCVGSDEEFDKICVELGIYRCSHPPEDEKKRAFCKTEEERMPAPYLVRNLDIVKESQILIATPKEPYEVTRSGTWSTYRRAKHLKRAICLVLPEEFRIEGDIKL